MKLLEIFTPDEPQKLSLTSLDRVFAVWLAGSDGDTETVNAVINRVGIAFGQILVESLEFKWVIVTDEFGTDLAVHALPDKGDVLVFPANFISKRWERRETNFLQPHFQQIAKQLDECRRLN